MVRCRWLRLLRSSNLTAFVVAYLLVFAVANVVLLRAWQQHHRQLQQLDSWLQPTQLLYASTADGLFHCADFPPLTVLQRLGRGWTKDVLEAETPTGRHVAVKMVNMDGHDVRRCMEMGEPRHVCRWRAARKIERELRLLHLLQHPNIVQLFGFCMSGGSSSGGAGSDQSTADFDDNVPSMPASDNNVPNAATSDDSEPNTVHPDNSEPNVVDIGAPSVPADGRHALSPSLRQDTPLSTESSPAASAAGGSVWRPVSALVVELGRPLSRLSLLQLSWHRRLLLARDAAALLQFLERPAGGAGAGACVADLRLSQFVLVDERLKLADLDDVSLEEPPCARDDDCRLPADRRSRRGACVAARCQGFNGRRNQQLAADRLFSPLLELGVPRQLNTTVQNILDRFSAADRSATQMRWRLDELLAEYRQLYARKVPIET